VLGPKTASGTEAAADFILDLHSTTSDMGLSLIMNADYDAFAFRVAHECMKKEPALKVRGGARG
jgi:succinylglutamate desuccinylase